MDFTLPPNNPEAAKYSQLGRAALSLRSVAENPQIETIQTLALLGGYRHMAGGKACIDSAWSYASFSIKLAQSVSISLFNRWYRDCALWGLDTKTVQRRRLTFWSMAATEIFFALHTGRPPSCSLSYVDCEFPIYDGQNSTKDEAATQLFKLWHFRSLKEWIIPACQHMMAVPGPNYQSLLALERKMLQETPPSFEFLTDPDTSGRPSREARSYIMSLLRVNTMMYIHRSFFAQAILDKPDNPFLSPYAHSYLTAYRCASTQLSVSLHFYNKCPLFFQRLTPFWTNAFTAAVS
ncbi:hypothetical protein GLOTRDRAFT_47185 [Gloeophyllum trabeum ATCC 11539]|uniref:Xylanolytic transcriptional activator regulatory domain-containing protein n=1 Tax=Gloeophyllum trabeum (strain ATCC 11539 / FP-39264 / Madison 617) TaxID=670483 RepID=S7PYD6_GLOTA|nr:uncharacterized protein GLOTRDRAFT_47185 [Gloeophyllum trabeum ATCC 11539]EPQ52661.1 hypothetical protein GLOTRDRAFT_47185 [Gloeophyllum trabeum ATCC 11539]